MGEVVKMSRFCDFDQRKFLPFLNGLVFVILGNLVVLQCSPRESPELSLNSTETLNSITNGSANIRSTTEKPIINSTVGNSSTSTKSTSSNYIEYKPLVFESAEDKKTQEEWGGNCSLADWDNCKVLQSWFGNYEDPKDGEIKEYKIDCGREPVVCLKNSWSVTRCNLLCMSRCNREIQAKYDKYVLHSGECQAHAHGR